MTAFFHSAFIVDLVVLRELQTLVARAMATQDAAELHEFETSRAAAYTRLKDAHATMLDADVMTTALAHIATLTRSPLRDDPEAKRLLELARTVSTRPRYVSKQAYAPLPERAARLKSLIELNAPPNIMQGDVRLILRCLTSLDRFDYLARLQEGRGREPTEDASLAEVCLGLTYVADTKPIGMRDLGAKKSFAFVGEEVFPKPAGGEALASWSRFCGSFSPDSSPRVVAELGVAYTMKAVMMFKDEGLAKCGLSARKRKRTEEALIDYAWALKTAHENGQAVVEWTHPLDDEDDEDDDEDSDG
jgi:hypothetical protein